MASGLTDGIEALAGLDAEAQRKRLFSTLHMGSAGQLHGGVRPHVGRGVPGEDHGWNRYLERVSGIVNSNPQVVRLGKDEPCRVPVRVFVAWRDRL